MKNELDKDNLYKKILDEQNIFSAIFCMESYIFDKGLLDTTTPITCEDEEDKTSKIIATSDLDLYYALADKHNMQLIEKVIALCHKRLTWLFADKKHIFPTRVYFKLKSYDNDNNTLEFRPLHTASLIDMICMVCILTPLMYEDEYKKGKRNLSDLSKLIPHNFYGNIPSTNVQYLFHKWQNKYKEYSEVVTQHCRTYQRNHKYLAEVCLDIKNFFPSISPQLLFNYIVEKMSSTYEKNLDMLKMAVAKLLYFQIDRENIRPWHSEYYPKGFNMSDDNIYMNCGIPQGLPQSYFFGNLCMIEVQNLLMREECFKGDAYFYVDDSVIYIKSELQPNEFKNRISVLNRYLEEWCDQSKSPNRYNLNEFISEDYIEFQAKIKYKIAFHKEKKSIITPIDEVNDNIPYLERTVSGFSNIAWHLDEIDDQVSLEKLTALDEYITKEISELKHREKDLSDNNGIKERLSSRLKYLHRFKKYFLYRNRLLKIKESGGPNIQMINDFNMRFLSADIPISDWFEHNEEDIFQSEYRLIIQQGSKQEAEQLSKNIQEFEKRSLQEAKDKQKYLYFSKDVQAALYMKTLNRDVYVSLIRWVRENFRGSKSLEAKKQMEVLRDFVDKDTTNMMDEGFEKKSYTKFVLNASSEYQRRVLNTFFSEVIGIQPSDSLIFTKTNCRKICYTELRLMARVRNRRFDLPEFHSFVKHIEDRDVSNRMIIDMGILDVLNRFIKRVKNPKWVDDLILTHRLTKGLWYNGSKFLNSYTLHNEEHAIALINNSLKLTNRIDYFLLKDVDYYILFLACYLHDISMVIHPDLSLLSSETGNNLTLISNLMSEMREQVEYFASKDPDPNNSRIKKAGNFLVKVFNDVYSYFENEVRAYHAKDSAQFIKDRSNSLLSYLEPTLLSLVAKVSESHGYDIPHIYGLRSRAKDDTVSLKYLMMLIRLADLMDVASDRVNYHLLRQNLANLSLTSKFHWISHLVTDKMELKPKYKIEKSNTKNRFKGCIHETIEFNLYLNIKQLTNAPKTKKCNNCDCTISNRCLTINIRSESMQTRKCSQESCTVLCQWMMKKHEWLVPELIALNEYLYSVNNPLFKTSIKINIYFENHMNLDPDMFDSVQEFLSTNN